MYLHRVAWPPLRRVSTQVAETLQQQVASKWALLVASCAPARVVAHAGDLHGPKPYKFTGFGDLHGPKPYEFIRFGDPHGPKPYEFRGFGDLHGPKPYKFIGFGEPEVQTLVN